MNTNCIMEFTITLNHNQFQKLISRISQDDKYGVNSRNEVLDDSLGRKGIMVLYRNSEYKKKITLMVDVLKLLDGDVKQATKLVKKLEKHIAKYFCYKLSLSDFTLSRATFATDLKVGRDSDISNYLKVVKRIGKVKGFSPFCPEFLDEVNNFCLHGNSNGIDFLLYDLGNMVTSHLENADIGRQELQSVKAQTNGIIRVEVRLTKPKAVKNYTDSDNVPGQLAEMWENRQHIFMDTFVRVIPFGNYYRKDKAVEIVRCEVTDNTMRRKMLRLLELIPEKKSIWLAQKAMQCRDVDKIMKSFTKIELSPVTISKRHEVKRLKSLYNYL